MYDDEQNEQYTLYKIAYELAAHHQFEPLYINDGKEIWLEMYQQKTSYVVRLQHGGFDWKNHLKQDIANIFQKVKAMKGLLRGKSVEIYNVYVSAHEPLDDWEFLKKPMQLKEKTSVKMHVYYISDMNDSSELRRFQADTGADDLVVTSESPVEEKSEEQLQDLKTRLTKMLRDKEAEVQNVFSRGKPFWTYILLAVNVILFGLLTMFGGSENLETLVKFGAKYNVGIIEDGEWWRIITSMFLHIGVFHLLMNMLAVYFLGTAVERIFGSWRFIVIYFLSGIGGGLASFAFTANISAGASGALFGLFGALLYFGTVYKKIFLQTMGQNIMLVLIINLIFGFSVSQIDMGAHLGGLVTGFLASAVVAIPHKRRVGIQLAAGVGYIVIAVALIIYGFQANQNDPSYQLLKMDELRQSDQYEAMIESATTGLEHKPDQDEEALLRFQRSYAYLLLNQPDKAIPDLEKTIKLDDSFTEAFNNLASAYYQTGSQEQAEEMIKRAYELNPDDQDIQSLYREITGEAPGTS
ncbi:Rhomboid protease [Lentibacillus sp. JNUCC-1]|uniref:rhomboid family protein n=1 Tax=Lentibacillus sp. JNUCC-1 TaxID=2654513 RepID=UPI0012E897AC|nr:rhomboid family intramembrane serine protease [Lentibacillus sp. JNUCC-1]MUV39636.1 Rhomboid protease [Lentibacillus sp. JNUCC-1]